MLGLGSTSNEAHDQNGRENEDDDSNSAEGGLNISFTRMMKNIIGSEKEHPEVDDDVANALADIEQPEELGPAVSVHVAEAYNKAVSRQISKETGDKLRQGIRVPENCTTLRVPKVNPEIWQHLPAKARLVDIKSQKFQSGLSSALCVLATVSDEIARNAKDMPREVVGKVLKMGLDGANLIGTQFQEISQRRRQEVKPYMNPDYAGICNAQLPPSEFLFGPNLAETLKSTKAAATVIRSSTQGTNRFRPYPSSSRGSSLNSPRPFPQQRGGWNGQARGRPFVRTQFNRPFGAKPYSQFQQQRRQ